MNLSIRNRLPAVVVSVNPGEVMATVKAQLSASPTQEITAAITLEAVHDLGITPGTDVTALIKATEVALSIDAVDGISIRNQIPGTVTAVVTGGAMATVKLTVAGGTELTAAITKDAIEDLGLAPGAPVVALVKSTEVSLAIG
jgi:molybdate transport system regulatory protein